MSTIIGVMDEDNWHARTDNLVHVRPEDRELTWIPRDLWCEAFRDRINIAYTRGGPDTLRRALADHEFSVDYVVCIRRGAVEAFLQTLTVTVPVHEREEYWYPMYPDRPLQEGRRRIVFEPPEEKLQGMRLHEWIGARKPVQGAGSDLHRIARQQVLMRRLLEERIDFHPLLTDPERIEISDSRALLEIAEVRPSWKFSVFDEVRGRTIDGKEVLVSTRTNRGKGR